MIPPEISFSRFIMDDGVRNRSPATSNAAENNPSNAALPPRPNRFDNNKYNTRKTLAKGLLDVTLLTNNISNLKQLLKHQGTDRENPFFEYVVGGLLISVGLQVNLPLPLSFTYGTDKVIFATRQLFS